jgi:hypothetical protein
LVQTLHKHVKNSRLVNEYTSVMNRNRYNLEASNPTSRGQIGATKYELLELLRVCAQGEFLHNLVLDGIDECNSPVELLTDLSRVFDNTAVKVVLFGRSSTSPLLGPFCKNTLAIGKSVGKDIEAYLSRNLHELITLGLLPSNIDINGLLIRLTADADGIFQWAKLMISNLSNPALTRRDRREVIENGISPEDLEQLYNQILRSRREWEVESIAISPMDLWIAIDCSNRNEML